MSTTNTSGRASGRGPSGSSAISGANSMVAAGTALVIGVYFVGFMRTKAASDRFDNETEMRRPAQAISAPSGASASNATPTVTESIGAPPPERPATPLPETVAAAAPPTPGRAPDVISPAAASVPAAKPVTTAKTAPVESSALAATASSAIAAVAATTTPVTTPTAAVVVASPTPTSAATAEASPSTATAPVASAAPAAASAGAAVAYKDGVYTGWGTCRHGDIQATVTIQSGRIASAVISQCWTRYPCSWIAPLPPQVAQRQSAEVDYVSGATQSTNAFYYAVIEALTKAK